MQFTRPHRRLKLELKAVFYRYPFTQFRLVLLGLGLIWAASFSIASVFACAINQPQGKQTSNVFMQNDKGMQSKASFSNLLQQVSLNTDSPSDYRVSNIEGLDLNVQAEIDDSRSTASALFVPIKVDYTLTNRRRDRVALLNKLPPISFGELGSFSPFYPVVFQDESYRENFSSALRGWSSETQETYASMRMFFGRPPGDATPTKIEYLVIPGRTIILHSQSFNEKTTAYITNNSSALETLKIEGLSFCVQVVMDEQVINGLPDQALVSSLSSDLPNLSSSEYSNPSDLSLPKLPSSQLLCKNVAINDRS